jgi:hypothetical protein
MRVAPPEVVILVGQLPKPDVAGSNPVSAPLKSFSFQVAHNKRIAIPITLVNACTVPQAAKLIVGCLLRVPELGLDLLNGR